MELSEQCEACDECLVKEVTIEIRGLTWENGYRGTVAHPTNGKRIDLLTKRVRTVRKWGIS